MSSTIGTGENQKRFFLGFRSGHGVDAYSTVQEVFSDDTMLFSGECRYSKDSFSIVLTKDNLWNDAYPILKFKRIE